MGIESSYLSYVLGLVLSFVHPTSGGFEGAVPQIEEVAGKLIVAQNVSDPISHRNIHIFDSHTMTLDSSHPGGSGNLGMGVDPQSGWGVVCTLGGQRVVFFNVRKSHHFHHIDFPPTRSLRGCAGVAIRVENQRPQIFVGSPGTQEILHYDPFHPRFEKVLPYQRIVRVYSSVSGPFFLKVNEKTIYGSHAQLNPNFSRPFGIDRQTGERHFVQLERQYARSIEVWNSTVIALAVDSHLNGSVHFIRTVRQADEVDQLDLPEGFYPAALSRYRNCLVILGNSQDSSLFPGWIVLDLSQGRGERKIVRKTAFYREKVFSGAIRQRIDAKGRVWIAGSYGLIRVQNLFQGLSCGAPISGEQQKQSQVEFPN